MADISKISPDNGTTIYDLKDIEARKRVPEVLLKDTVGWTGKNLLDIPASVVTQTINGVTFTVNRNANGEVTYIDVDGTASAETAFQIFDDFSNIDSNGKYILTGCPASGGTSTYKLMFIKTPAPSLQDLGSGVTIDMSAITSAYNIRIVIGSRYVADHLKFYPMLRDASILDDTYEPYHASVEEVIGDMRAEQRVLGAKNLLPNSASTQTINGVTFTVNDDGSVMVNGTATASAELDLISQNVLATVVANTSLILSGGVSNNVKIYTQKTDDTLIVNNGIERTIEAGSTFKKPLRIQVDNGYTANNVIIYPMLRLASDPDDTYVPYAMTNRELTEKKINLSDLKTVVSASSDFANFQTRIASL